MTVAQKAATAAQWLMNAAMKANPIGLVIGAIGLLVVAWLKWDDEIMSFLRGTWNLVKKGFNAFKGWVTEAFGRAQGLARQNPYTHPRPHGSGGSGVGRVQTLGRYPQDCQGCL